MLRALALRTAFLGSEMLFRQLGCVSAARTSAVPLRQPWGWKTGTVQLHSSPRMLRSGRVLQARPLHTRQVVAALGAGVAEESPEPGDHRKITCTIRVQAAVRIRHKQTSFSTVPAKTAFSKYRKQDGYPELLIYARVAEGWQLDISPFVSETHDICGSG